MAEDLTVYRAGRTTPKEQARIADLFTLIPERGERAIDIGTRDGYLAARLADRFDEVIALDLEKPPILHPKVIPLKGNAMALEFPDKYFDTVLCSEVLEHIPTEQLPKVCNELQRVSRGSIIIGVPYRQDLRCGRTTCQHCGKINPPYGHLNSFDESSLQRLFDQSLIEDVRFFGTTRYINNSLSARLLDYADNPFGTYDQEEPCIFCSATMTRPPRNLGQRLATRLAFSITKLQVPFTKQQANWIHLRLRVMESS